MKRKINLMRSAALLLLFILLITGCAHSPSSEEAIDSVSPSPEEVITASPSPEEVITASPSPEEVITASPSPEEVITASPSPEEDIAVSPSPEEDIAHSPSSEETKITEPQADDKAETESEPKEDPAPRTEPDTSDLRKLFVGDSRTIDIFADSDENIYNEVHDGIHVYGGHGLRYSFLTESVDDIGLDNFDMLICWLGANDVANYKAFQDYYDELMAKGKIVILCTVGPTKDDYLVGDDAIYYRNTYIEDYNKKMTDWATERGVKVLDLYDYVLNNVEIDPADGIHYLPRPNPELWKYIIDNI